MFILYSRWGLVAFFKLTIKHIFRRLCLVKVLRGGRVVGILFLNSNSVYFLLNNL